MKEEEGQPKEQPKKTVRDIYSQETIADLLVGSGFVNELKSPDEVAVHNDRMRLIQKFIGGDGEKYLKFLNEVARLIVSL